MITINLTWHLILFIIVMVVLVGGLIYSIATDNSRYLPDLMPFIWFLGIALVVLVYGGINWW